MGVEGPLDAADWEAAPQGAFSHVLHSRVQWGQWDQRESEPPFPARP